MSPSAAHAGWIVYGARGHGRVVADTLLALRANVIAFVDDDAKLRDTVQLGVEVRDFDWLRAHNTDGLLVALAVGDNVVRRDLFEKCTRVGLSLGTVVHERAVVSSYASVARGTVILAGAVVNANASVGEGAIVNTGAIVEHDVIVGPFAHVSPNAVLAGGARLGELSHLGAGAVVRDDTCVGSRTTIGAGAVVTKHIGDGVVAFGVPARVRREAS
jgi:sugar O-acyltransferase (sialic acid O-acetyltransferase NeuD family)